MMIRSIITAGVVAVSTVAPVYAQVTTVSQLRDVQPTEWSYQAVSNLVSRYGCVAGFPDGTFRPGQPATRSQLAALTSACLDRIVEFQTQADATLAAALRAEFSTEIAKTNNRVTALEVASERKAMGVGTYVGAGVTLNRQGIDGGGYDYNRTVAGATVQGRFPVASVWGNDVSLRPYINFAAGPDSNIASAGGALATYDFGVLRKTLADGSRVSSANLYVGVGGQWAFTNDGQANYQSSIGNGSNLVFVTGIEGRLTNSLVGFADIKWPTDNSGVDGSAYSPVGTVGVGFKF